MKKIGYGWQYNVYELSPGRILKKVRSGFPQYRTAYARIKQDYFFPVFETIRHVRRVNAEARAVVVWLQGNPEINPALLGNPKMVSSTDYTQDRVVTMGHYLQEHSIEENKKILEDYVEFFIELLKYGIADSRFKFDKNNGVDSRGMVIQIDLSELQFHKEKILKDIEDKKWLAGNCYQKRLVEPLKSYYANLMAVRLTVDSFNKVWKSKIKN